MYHGGGMPGGGHLHGASGEYDDDVLGKIYDQRIISRLLKYLPDVRFHLSLGAIGMVVRSLASLATPYLVAVAIDRIEGGDFGGLNIVAIIFLAAALLFWGGRYVEDLFLGYAGQGILFRMRTQMFDHLQRLSLNFFSHTQVGKIMSRVQNDVQQIQELITSGVLNIVTSALTLVGIAVAMIIMNARLALLTLTVVPVLAIVVILWQKYARITFIRVRQAIATVNAQLQEGISGVRVTQSLSRENENFRQFDATNRAHLDANIDAARMQAVMMPTVEILTAVATGLVIIFGGYQVLDGVMGVGFLLGFVLYIQRFFDPILELTMEYTQLQRAMASGSRIFELLDVEPEINDSPRAIELPPSRGGIRLDQVSFGYDAVTEILHDIDLTINPGETVAIVGQTGAGKSSLVNLIARFYEAGNGRVLIDGHDVRDISQQSLRRQIGIVPQDPFLFSGSIEDNIRYGNPEASHDEIVAAAKIAGADDFIGRLELGYDTPVGERGGNLSAGQRQFICLARAILVDPPILILDEATSNIDTNAERLMQQSLRRLVKGRTCLIIAHRLSTVTSADRIIVLERGRIAETGAHRELMATKGLYYKMFSTLNATEPG